MKNFLQYKTKEEFIDYLDKLTQEELIQEFNISDNLYSKLRDLLNTIVITIFIKYYDKPLDDICYNKINDYDKYIEEYLIDFSKYLEEIVEKVKELLFYTNKEKLQYNSMSWGLKEDNSNIKEVIIDIYEEVINNDYNGIYNRLVLLVSKLKKHIDNYEYLKYIKKDKDNLSIDESINSDTLENRSKIETLKIIVNNLLKVSEIISENIIDLRYDFKELLSEENYEILERNNLINKLSLILDQPIVGSDIADIYFKFKNKKISKIIDNNIEKEFNTVNKYTGVIYLLLTEKENNLLKIYKKVYFLRKKYYNKDYEVDVFPGLIFGDEREIIIVIGE